MKKLIMLTLILFLVPASSYALLFNFGPESDLSGTGTATMNIVITDNIVSVTIENTSPVNLDGETNGGNSPAIVGFGFNLDPDSLGGYTWDLEAYSDAAQTSFASMSSYWSIGTKVEGIELDFIPYTQGVDGGLYNPDAFYDTNNEIPGGQNAVFYTTAIFTMTFGEDFNPILNTEDYWSPYVRMQNVGESADGSLKLPGTPVPEPATMLLLGAGLVGIAGASRKKFFKNS